MPRHKNQRAFIDILTLIGVLFLIASVGAGVVLIQQNQNIIEQAAKPKKTGNSAYDKCREDSGRKTCNEKLGLNVNWKGEIVNEIDTSRVDKDAPPGQLTCDANGTQYSPGAVVLYGGIGSNAKCGNDGRWETYSGPITDVKPENVPEYAKETYKKAVEEKETRQQQEQLAQNQQKAQEEELAKENLLMQQRSIDACAQGGGSWQNNSCSYPEVQQPVADTSSTTTPDSDSGFNQTNLNDNPLANLFGSVGGGTALNESNTESSLNTSPYLTGLGSYGLGGGNAYVAPIPINIITSKNSRDFYGYATGNALSAGSGFTAATLLTPGAPAFLFETIIPSLV